MSIEGFAREYDFPFDSFQREACAALEAGRNALVCAPTGAGKTVVGEYAVWRALQTGGKAFYTTPLKALSNQKFGDFRQRHGPERIGLLTGDNAVNGEAPAVVMTTEVLRNMLYEGSPTLDGLRMVVLDEVHFLQDRYRGATWEEVIIHLPPSVRIAALSATLSNAGQFGDWLRSVRGPTDVVVEQVRPVPIEHRYFVGDTLFEMFVRDGRARKPNPAVRRIDEGVPRDARRRPGRGGARPRSYRRRSAYRPDRVDVVRRLAAEGMLPAITFIFSRAGCQDAVRRCVEAGVRLTDATERKEIRRVANERVAGLRDDDLEALGFETWRHALERGIAAHHAGMIPAFKETVEALFARALVKAVFATETLALGINMPARTVVIERLIKFNGERHELMTPGDHAQLTGRAGRRGKDEVGFGITLFQPDVPFERVASLAEGRSYPIASSFRPSYNMAVNLLASHSVEEAIRLLNLSFGQFMTDASLVQLTNKIEHNERFVAGYRERARCDLGDVDEYWALATKARAMRDERQVEARRSRNERVRRALSALPRGAVLKVQRGPRAGLVAVAEVRRGKHGEPQPVVITADRRMQRLAVRDFVDEPAIVGRVKVPAGDVRDKGLRHAVAQQLARVRAVDAPRAAAAAVPEPEAVLRARLEAHAVWSCPDRREHETWLDRIERLDAETARLRARVDRRGGSLARAFQRVLEILEDLGYVHEGAVTDRGARLARIYNESDLLVALAVDRGLLDGLEPPELAAVASCLVYETRIGEPEAIFTGERERRAFRSLMGIYRDVAAREEERSLALVREPDPGFAWRVHRWASGEDLADVVGEQDQLLPGDFVRWVKQVWDLLGQIAGVASEDVAANCRTAARAIYRGVVSVGSV